MSILSTSFTPFLSLSRVPSFTRQTQGTGLSEDTQGISDQREFWVCLPSFPFVHQLTLQTYLGRRQRIRGANPTPTPNQAKLERGPKGSCCGSNRMSLQDRGPLVWSNSIILLNVRQPPQAAKTSWIGSAGQLTTAAVSHHW
jgi:hypothetical protein